MSNNLYKSSREQMLQELLAMCKEENIAISKDSEERLREVFLRWEPDDIARGMNMFSRFGVKASLDAMGISLDSRQGVSP